MQKISQSKQILDSKLTFKLYFFFLEEEVLKFCSRWTWKVLCEHLLCCMSIAKSCWWRVWEGGGMWGQRSVSLDKCEDAYFHYDH